MTRTTTPSPEAYIAVGGNRQKIYSDKKIYLEGGTEFQLELFNGTTGIVAAKIYINDEPISNSLIVLRPGVREYLDRYIDDNKKFLFDTYKVEDSQEAKDAIANNGNVRVEFFRSVMPQSNPIITTTGGWPPYFGIPAPYFGTGIPDYNIYCNTTSVSGSSVGPIGVSGTLSSNFCASSIDNGQAQACMDNLSFGDNNINEIETGRIEGGAASEQSFTNYNGEFEYFAFVTSEYQILPSSVKPVEISKIRQYCPGCRNRIRKSSWQFCPACGEALD